MIKLKDLLTEQNNYTKTIFDWLNKFKPDFMKNSASSTLGEVIPSYRPGVVLTDLRECLPNYVIKTMQGAVNRVSKQIVGFDRKDAVLTAT